MAELVSAPFSLLLGPETPADLRVTRLRGREALSRCFRWDISVSVPLSEAPLLEHGVLRRSARLHIEAGRAIHVVHGVVSRVSSAGAASQERRLFLVRVVPRLALLRHRVTTRIFQQKSTPEVVADVLAEHAIPHAFQLRRTYPRHAYCTQYEETDLAFIERLLAESGLHYAFDPPDAASPLDASETLIVGDSAQYRPISGDPVLRYRPTSAGGAMAPEENHVQSFSRTENAASVAYERRDHDFERPHLPLRSRAGETGGGAALMEVYEHHGAHSEAESEVLPAEGALEQIRRRANVADGRSACRRLSPGRTFVLEEHDLPSHDGEHVVTEVTHRGRGAEIAGDRMMYENRFSAAPATHVVRPPRRARKVRQSLETAVVVGPPGQEIHTDAHGRVKVQFPWDRQGRTDERSSCWIRVAQAWAGAGWGTQLIPRVGMEVLVAFVGGDPDRPMIIGCVPNATRPPPYPLPENATRSGLKSHSTPGGGGFNEILLEDRKGEELLALRAERNLTETVLHDRSASVGRDDSLSIKGDRTVEIRGADTLEVQGALSCRVQGGASLSVGGHATGAVAGHRETSVAGDDTTRAGGGMTLSAAGYLHQIIGHGAPEGHGVVLVNGNYRIGVAGKIDGSAAKGITFACGESVLEILPDEVKIRTPKLTLIATDSITAQGKDNALSMAEHVELRGADVRVFGKDSSLVLDDDGKLNGRHVKLNCDRPKPEQGGAAGGDEEGTITFKVKPHFPVQPGDRLVAVIATPTGETVERDVDAAMEVKLEGKKGDVFVLVDLRKGELPFGKRG